MNQTLKKQGNPPEQLTCFPEGSPDLVSHTVMQEKDLARKTLATSGRRCLEQLEKFNHVGSWAKTFLASLVGMTGWSSKRCKLTWKLKGTKYNRLYFQLVPLMLLTDEKESSLLPTPSTRDYKGTNDLNRMKEQLARGERAHQGQLPNYLLVQTGEAGQLNPRFVLEMMGFPPDWTELPFLNGETNQSKQQETQSVLK